MNSTAATSKMCFVVGPIGAVDSEVRVHADWLLEEIIQPTMSEFPEFQVKRADQDHRPGLIDAQLINDLLTADLVIADLSGLNPNAFYEIGIRHMAQKPIIHMQLSNEQLPFDVSLFRSIKFSRLRPRDLREARAALRLQIEATMATDYIVENPITNARGRFKLEADATSGTKVLLNEIAGLNARVGKLESGDERDDLRVRLRNFQLHDAIERLSVDENFTISFSGGVDKSYIQNIGRMLSQQVDDVSITRVDRNRISGRIIPSPRNLDRLHTFAGKFPDVTGVSIGGVVKD